ncbi:cysteine--tRNA ligase [Nocardioides ferulae]|uniref:cysteine--tRNA ligase n=1 Tax=Nocardioides ferulae TaxID=2340821 RepID=UPI000EAB634D|nr:cysteine--tRNA ligase [Nocardioides ferulae]
MSAPLSPSGVVGLAGRVPAVDSDPVRSGALVLAGAPLPLTGALHLYTCGITPYDVTHLGHAATFVWADALAAVAREAGVTPVVCRNVTDVDDVLTDAATGRGWPYDEFALTQEFLFDRDMAALRVAAPTHAPHARAHVRHVVQLAAALLRAGAAYEREGHVFFRGAPAVAGSGVGESEAARLAEEFGDRADDGRDDPCDVPVWRPSAEDQPAWPSPWGWGRPGWHAECAAMAWSVCGASVDVLAGGADLAFPHHAYQAAMVEAASGVAPFARRQVHWGEVRLDGAKMAKSTGNLVLVADLLAEHRPAAVRLLLLDRPWAEPWDYRAEDLQAAERRLDELYAAAGRPGAGRPDAGPVLDRLLHDLDVPGAVAVALDQGGASARALLRVLKLDA